MQTSEINAQLAMRAISRWKIDPSIRRKFAKASDFYDYLAAQDIKAKAREEWEASAELRKHYKTFTDYLVSQFADRQTQASANSK